MRSIVLAPGFIEDLTWWVKHDRKTALRLLRIVVEILRDPQSGIGKPEPLKHLGAGLWSRRLTQRDRVVYRVFDDRIEFIQGRLHY